MGNLTRRIILLIALLMASGAYANVIINGTRVIYNADENEATIRLSNASSTPSLVQVWLDSGDAKSTPETGKSPFIATPPVFRVEPNKAQTVRIIYTREPLPNDRESVFWLNVLDVPPMPITKDADDANYMQFAIKSRIKLFYRPKNLPGSAPQAAEQIHWQLRQKGDDIVLQATNDAAYSVSMNTATIQIADKTFEVATEMILPASGKEFLVKDLKTLPTAPCQLNYTTINDFGSAIEHNTTLPR